MKINISRYIKWFVGLVILIALVALVFIVHHILHLRNQSIMWNTSGLLLVN
jgi:hypothetical protein